MPSMWSKRSGRTSLYHYGNAEVHAGDARKFLDGDRRWRESWRNHRIWAARQLFVDPKTNELYVADGYGNKRVIVFDADTGKYKRHWGAYGNKSRLRETRHYNLRIRSCAGRRRFNLSTAPSFKRQPALRL